MRFGEIKKQLAEGWNNGEDRVHLPDEPSLYWSGKGPLQNEYDALYEKLVPSQGKADTIEGEVLRAASKIVYRHYNDGDEFNAASYRQLEKYIGKVTSYDDLAHKSTEFAVKANGQYHPNADWDCLAVMDYGPVDDYDDEDEDEDEYGWEEDDDELEEADMFKAGQRAIKNIKSTTQQRKSEAEKMAQAQAQIDADRENERDRFSQEELYPSDDSHDVDEGMEEFAKSQAKQRAAKRKSIPWPKEVPTDAEQERNRTRDEEENDPHPYTQVNEYDDEDEYEDEDQGFFVAIGSEDDGGFVGMVTKDGGKWREGRVSGKAPYNWGGSYMGYLTPDDVMTWIRKDYRNYDVEGPFDSEEEAREYAQNQYSLDEAKWFKTSYGWAGGRNEKTGGTYKHPDQIKADREAKKAAKAQQSKDAMTGMFGGDASALTSKLKIREDGSEEISSWNIPQEEWAAFEEVAEQALAAVESEEAWKKFFQVADLEQLDKPMQDAIDYGLGSGTLDEFTSDILGGLRAGYEHYGTEPRAALDLATYLLSRGVHKLQQEVNESDKEAFKSTYKKYYDKVKRQKEKALTKEGWAADLAKSNRERMKKERDGAKLQAKMSQPVKAKPDYSRVFHDINMAIGDTFPDGDPMDALMRKYRDSYGDLNIDLLNKACRVNGAKSYHDYVAKVWQQHMQDNPDLVQGGNPWVAEGEVSTRKYEMMLRNGQVKKFVAKDDADAKRIAAGHGAKSVIRMKGNVPGNKIAENGHPQHSVDRYNKDLERKIDKDFDPDYNRKMSDQEFQAKLKQRGKERNEGVAEGWESGPEERTTRERDPDAEYDARRQEKLDAPYAQKEPEAKGYHVVSLDTRQPVTDKVFPTKGHAMAYIQSNHGKNLAYRAINEHWDQEGYDPRGQNPELALGQKALKGKPVKGKDAANLAQDALTKAFGGTSKDLTSKLSIRKGVAEDIEPTNPVERAVLAAIRELIQQGHTEVAPEVITNMVVAATSKPFLLKDLVDANKNSPAIQHYVDSINPSKVKFSSDILTVKNENPAKDKEQSQASVSAMAAKAANRPRLGEGQSTPLRDRDDYQAKQKALQDIQLDPHTHQDTQLSSELARRKAELIQQAKQLGISESRAHKIIANKLKQIELQRKMGSPESDAAHATHINRMKKSKEDYLAKNPNSIYKK